jgi:tetratricopeptide (TPR) repeat protein
MAVRKLQVFLASRFGEFAELRTMLRERITGMKVDAVDLNNQADSRPPLARCYAAVEQADIFVLLVGTTYGDLVQNQKASYTHLEYRHALDDGKVILPFFIGASEETADSNLRNWIKEILDNQTVRVFDSRLTPKEQADDIFKSVYERLLEIAAGADPSADVVDDDDDIAPVWEESPIEMQQLIAEPRTVDPAHLLRLLAADHAREAYEALSLNLPQVGIQQLRKAVEISPFEIVPAYWLARLLIATGRFSDCREGLRLALRCIHVLEQRPERAPELASMALFILSARASERLNDAAGALRYAEKAYKGKEFHWLANIEYGRQRALSGDANEALEYARKAFWARPDVIHRIQADSAFRGLGTRYDEFRIQLRDEVEKRAKDILLVELALRGVAAKRETGVLPSVGIVTSAEPKKRSLLWKIRIAKASSQRSLNLLRQWASELSYNVTSFTADSFKGLTAATGEQIDQAVVGESLVVATLDEQTRAEKHRMTSAGAQRSNIAGTGLLVEAVIILGFVWAASSSSWGWVALAVALFLLAGAAFSTSLQAARDRHNAAFQKHDQLARQLQQARTRLAAVADAQRQFRARVIAVRAEAEVFCFVVRNFEETVLRRMPLSPAVPWRRRGASQIVRIDSKNDVDPSLSFTNELLPPDLRAWVERDSLPGTYWLARRVGSGASAVFSRSAAYFT